MDIKEFNLPLLDEPVPPIMGQYHSKLQTENVPTKESVRGDASESPLKIIPLDR